MRPYKLHCSLLPTSPFGSPKHPKSQAGYVLVIPVNWNSRLQSSRHSVSWCLSSMNNSSLVFQLVVFWEQPAGLTLDSWRNERCPSHPAVPEQILHGHSLPRSRMVSFTKNQSHQGAFKGWCLSRSKHRELLLVGWILINWFSFIAVSVIITVCMCACGSDDRSEDNFQAWVLS